MYLFTYCIYNTYFTPGLRLGPSVVWLCCSITVYFCVGPLNICDGHHACTTGPNGPRVALGRMVGGPTVYFSRLAILHIQFVTYTVQYRPLTLLHRERLDTSASVRLEINLIVTTHVRFRSCRRLWA